MLGVLLTILKIIGLILLAILCLILLLGILILFVPIKYKAVGEYKNKKPDILLNVSYLLHILSISFTFKDKKAEFYIKIFGIKLKKKKPGTKKTKQKSTDAISVEESNIKTDAHKTDETGSVTDVVEEKNPDNENKSSTKEKSANDINEAEDTESNEENEANKTSFKDKISNVKKESEFYIKLIKSDYFKNTFNVIKHRIGRILKSILPKRGRINLWLGFENAGTTGEIVGVYKALYDYIGHVVKLNSYYDRECTDVDFNIKGRIYLFIILFHGLCILLNRNVLKILKMLKKHKK